MFFQTCVNERRNYRFTCPQQLLALKFQHQTLLFRVKFREMVSHTNKYSTNISLSKHKLSTIGS